jgi:hypothetical protein
MISHTLRLYGLMACDAHVSDMPLLCLRRQEREAGHLRGMSILAERDQEAIQAALDADSGDDNQIQVGMYSYPHSEWIACVHHQTS